MMIRSHRLYRHAQLQIHATNPDALCVHNQRWGIGKTLTGSLVRDRSPNARIERELIVARANYDRSLCAPSFFRMDTARRTPRTLRSDKTIGRALSVELSLSTLASFASFARDFFKNRYPAKHARVVNNKGAPIRWTLFLPFAGSASLRESLISKQILRALRPARVFLKLLPHRI